MTPGAIFIIWQIPLQGTSHSLLNGPQDKGRRRKRRVSVWWTITPILTRLLCLPSRLIFFLHGHPGR